MDLIEHRVRERAYYIWEDEGRVHGRADAHWLRAEAEIAAPAPILTVQAVAETTLAPSPAKTLKPRASRAKAAVDATSAPAAAKPASKTTAAKTTATKAASTKTTPTKAASKTAAPKAPKALAAAAAKAKTARTAASLH